MALRGSLGEQVSYEAAVSFVGKKFFAIKIDSNGKADLAGAGSTTERPVGIMIDEPASGEHGSVVRAGYTWAKAGGTITAGDKVTSDANGKLVTTTTDKVAYLGTAEEGAVLDQEFQVRVEPGFLAA